MAKTATLPPTTAHGFILAILMLVAAPAVARGQAAGESIQAILGPAIEQQHLSGAIVLVTDVNGPLLVEAVGSADLATQRPMTITEARMITMATMTEIGRVYMSVVVGMTMAVQMPLGMM